MASRNPLILAALVGATASLLHFAAAQAAEPLRCTVIIDEKSGEPLHRQGDCAEAIYPQSTFKLPIAMMGYDAGILTDAHNPRWSYQAKWQRPQREQKDTDPTIWERDSIVWYSQEITRRLGKEAFAAYIRGFNYGNRDVSGGPGGTDGLTQSWLMSSLKISADGQVDFLRRFLTGGLPISAEAVEKTKAITPRFDAADGWTVYGKTGSGSMRNKAGKGDASRPIGWFVGWAERQGRRVVFARLFVDTKRHTKQPISFTVRDSLIEDLPRLMAR
ncbi:class D beta-lactamase [Neorhizobium sp. SOG26]|uniref:class D beta-lactamase n=1 Tax=Neorhizobium sp. SOG26 TaxID=2060726 RepID=UPI000E5830FE|nr:class D beta-lactamase [Neorhizobium sp. SOG26]AXV14791.1 class D beta-lactamase [Neorhizobium sp. SOG26]